jgi:hypothetical protein
MTYSRWIHPQDDSQKDFPNCPVSTRPHIQSLLIFQGPSFKKVPRVLGNSDVLFSTGTIIFTGKIGKESLGQGPQVCSTFKIHATSSCSEPVFQLDPTC